MKQKYGLLLACLFMLHHIVFGVGLSSSISKDNFFRPPADSGAGLPSDTFYPKGRRLFYAGYSGEPARDLTNGFSVAGPVYGDQNAYLEKCFVNHWPVVAQISGPLVNGGFLKGAAGAKYDEEEVRMAVATQVIKWAQHPEIVWWAVNPEELRPWQKDEMEYLALVAETIRACDPQKRPVFMYNPNHRDAKTLEPIAKIVDILGKSAYVNSVGKKNERGWVGWSLEQEIDAAANGGRNATSILMPELCKDPPDSERDQIRSWVRHDVYLGLASGAKAVLIWSLFPRKEVKETWGTWYEAYAECGRELGEGKHLSEIFLFGEVRSDLRVTPESSLKARSGTLGGSAEANTTSEAERAEKSVDYKPFTVCERAFRNRRYLFVVNSTPEPVSFRVSGFPESAKESPVFEGQKCSRPEPRTLRIELPAWGVGAVSLAGD